MSLKGIWVDKVNGVDKIDASHINDVAHAVIELEGNSMECVGSVTVTPSIGQEAFYLGSDYSFNKNGGYMGVYALDTICRSDMVVIEFNTNYGNTIKAICGGGYSWETGKLMSVCSGGSDGVFIPSEVADMIFGEPSYNDQGHLQCEVLCSSVTFTGYKLPTA